MPGNGDAVILPTGTVTGLANYPRGRLAPTTSHRTLYISGTSSRRPDGTFDGVETRSDGTQVLDVRKQTAAILRNIEEVIKHATANKGGLGNVIDATIFLVDMERDYSGMNTVWNEFYPNVEEAPARTTIGVRELPSPKLVVEVKCTAIVEALE
ncbi:L-PSP endoribonuclease family protein [Colletotrichum asianum]|uniref:L-psp endoribonuclease family n=1 Tax=Colletotrichum asianum TaxID=702518 RepID=A0A8H3WH79_9PEZI|nr:l-psp endoribonuclease family [Colletotrichum asianum]